MRNACARATAVLGLTGCLVVGLAAMSRAAGDSDSDSDAPRVVTVDCTDSKAKKHQSIARALEKKATELIVEIDGICREDVVIRRDFVTLRGKNQNTDLDGIRGAAPGVILGGEGEGAIGQFVVLARGAEGVRLQHLTIGEGIARGGMAAIEGAVATLSDCVVENNPGIGVAVSAGASLFVRDSVVRHNGVAGGAGNGGYLEVVDSDLLAPAVIPEPIGLLSIFNGFVYMRGGSLSGMILSVQKSGVDLQEVTHTGGFNLLATDSTLRAIGSTVQGETVIKDFSTAVLREGSRAEGKLVCEAGGDAFCENPLTDVLLTSNCGQCFKP